MNHTPFEGSAAVVLLVMPQRVAVCQAMKLYIVPADTLHYNYFWGVSTIFFINFKVLLLGIIELFVCLLTLNVMQIISSDRYEENPGLWTNCGANDRGWFVLQSLFIYP